ncbi:RNA polymerase-associated protein CTR9-like protein [Aphelenchoides besseyi]|nr:RNA polymerase-associated protein CTR9-like protein [Aphelenchoides besseyi]
MDYDVENSYELETIWKRLSEITGQTASEKLLPDVQFLVDVLEEVGASLPVRILIATFYYRRDRTQDFVSILLNSADKTGDDRCRLRVFDMLAAFYVESGRAESDPSKRKEWFDKAMTHYAAGDQIIRFEPNHLVGRAHFCLLQNKIDEADAQLNFVLEQPGVVEDLRILIPALIGKGVILYQRGDFKASLSCFRRCLSTSPSCPAIVRLGMGYCFSKLGAIEKAKIAFERATEIDPTNIDAHAALAVLRTTSPQDRDEATVGAQTLATLFKRDGTYPLILNHLANHFIIKNVQPLTSAHIQLSGGKDQAATLGKAKKLAEKALTMSRNVQTLGESNFHLARVHHSLGEIPEAHRHYGLACQQSSSKFVLPFYGYAQTSVLVKDPEAAISYLENILKTKTNSVDVLKILGALYARSSLSTATDRSLSEERRQKAKELLQRAHSLTPQDPEILIDLAVLLQKSDQTAALEYYNQVVELLKELKLEAPAQLLNNIGESFLTCRNILTTVGVEDDKSKAAMINLSFNLARTIEKLGRVEEAEAIYKAIIQKVPKYVDAHFRLGCMHFTQQEMIKAEACFKEVIGVDSNNPDPWIMLGNINFENNELGAAQKKYDQALKLRDSKNDPSALVCMGNIWLKMLFNPNRQRKDDEKNQNRAVEFFLKALKVNPGNVFAAHGAGCVLAQKAEFSNALDVFGQVRENVSDYSDVWLNIANVRLDIGHCAQAATMYEKFLHRFPVRDLVDLFTNTAFALFRLNDYQRSLDWIDRALNEDPTNYLSHYNHAFVSMQFASSVLSNENSKLDDVKYAIECLNSAEQMFHDISELPVEQIQPYRYLSRTQCKELASKCTDLLRQSQQFVERAMKADVEERERLNRQATHRRALAEEQHLKMLVEQEIEKKRLDELKLNRRAYMVKMKEALKPVEVQEEPQQKRAAATSGGRKRKRAHAVDSDGFVNDSDENESNRAIRKKRKALDAKQNRKKDRDFIDDGNSDDGKSRRRKKKKEEVLDDESGRKAKVKSKAIIESDSSSSSSDSDDENPSASKSALGTLQAPITANIFGSDDEEDEETKPQLKKQVESSASDDDSDNDNQRATIAKAAAQLEISSDSEEEGNNKTQSSSSSSESDDDYLQMNNYNLIG